MVGACEHLPKFTDVCREFQRAIVSTRSVEQVSLSIRTFNLKIFKITCSFDILNVHVTVILTSFVGTFSVQ